MKKLSPSQRNDLRLIAAGFVSSSIASRTKPLIARGLVEDIGLYDLKKHCKRYGSDRYKITAAGRDALKAAS